MPVESSSVHGACPQINPTTADLKCGRGAGVQSHRRTRRVDTNALLVQSTLADERQRRHFAGQLLASPYNVRWPADRAAVQALTPIPRARQTREAGDVPCVGRRGRVRSTRHCSCSPVSAAKTRRILGSYKQFWVRTDTASLAIRRLVCGLVDVGGDRCRAEKAAELVHLVVRDEPDRGTTVRQLTT